MIELIHDHFHVLKNKRCIRTHSL